MKKIDLNTGKTIICDMIGWEDPETTILDGETAVRDGAEVLTIGFERLRPEFRNGASIRKIVDSFDVPCMFHFYRKNEWNAGIPDDETIVSALLDAANSGCAMVDVMGDLYAPAPDERAIDPSAIEKQKALIAKIHSRGSLVVMSSHPLRKMDGDSVVDQLKDFESRGADVVKIVTMTETEDDFIDTIATTARLRRELKTPFIFLSGGKFGYAHRMAGLSLGVAMSFTLTDREGWRKNLPSNPLTRTMRAVRDRT